MKSCLNVSNDTSGAKFNITNDCALFDFSIYTVVVGTLCIMGFVGNALSFSVLWQDTSKGATAFLLRAMAVADTLVLLVSIPLYSITPINPFSGYLKSYYDAYLDIVPWLWPCYLIPYTGTILLTVLVSLNRYFCVCRPFKSADLCSQLHARRHVVYVVFFSIIYNIPRFFEYHKVEICVGYNESKWGFDISPFGNNKLYRVIYANIMYFVVLLGGPLLALAFLNVKLILALKRRQRKRQEMGKAGGGGGEQDMTLVLVVVIFSFLFCQTPTFVDHILWTVVDESKRHCGHWHYYYTAIGDMMAILNSSVNFFIYVMTSSKFRQNLLSSCRLNKHFMQLPTEMTVVQTNSHLKPEPSTALLSMQNHV